MTSARPGAGPDPAGGAAAYPGAAGHERLRPGRLRFFRTIAASVGVQGPTGGVVIGAAILAGISGGGTALVQVVAAVAMGFVAYAFVLFTRGFNSAGSVYGFAGAVAGPAFGFLTAWTLLLVYVDFAAGVYLSTADEAQPALAALGLHLPWQACAIIACAAVLALALLDIKVTATVILVAEAASMLLVTIACVIITARGGYHGHAFSPAPFEADGATLPVLGLGIVYAFSAFSGFEAAATLGEESRQPQRLIPAAIALSLAVAAIFEVGVAAVVTNAYPGVAPLAASAVPLVTVTDRYVAGWMGELVNIGAVISSFGAALACAVGAARILFALGRDTGPALLRRTSRRTGAPAGALAVAGGGSAAIMAAFLAEPQATRAVAVSLTYGADLIIAAYVLVVAAAIVFTLRRRSRGQAAVLAVGLVFLGYVIKVTFVPLPPAPYRYDALAAAVTLAAGAGLPLAVPRLRRAITASPLLRAGSGALLPGRGGPPD